MQTITVKNGQTSLDVAMQYCGDAAMALLLSANNGKSITDDIAGLEDMVTPDPVNKKYSAFARLIPASAVTEDVNEFAGIEAYVLALPHTDNNKRVRDAQTSLDIAMQYCGDATVALLVAKDNGKSLTDDLVLFEAVKAPAADVSKEAIASTFRDNGLIPASGGTLADGAFPEGIGYWYIENPVPIFTVS